MKSAQLAGLLLALLISFTAQAEPKPYQCSFGDALQTASPTCELFNGTVFVMCQYYVYPQNHVLCQEAPGHIMDLCDRSLDQLQLLPTTHPSTQACMADSDALNALCEAAAPTPIITGSAECTPPSLH